MTNQTYHTNGVDGKSSGIDNEKAQRATRLLLDAIGENPERDGIEDTWQRRIPAALETLTEVSVRVRNLSSGRSMLR